MDAADAGLLRIAPATGADGLPAGEALVGLVGGREIGGQPEQAR